MQTSQSIEIIETMLRESKKSLHRNSFYFLIWGLLLVPAGIAEYYLFGTDRFWLIWPVVGIIGGLISTIYGIKEGKRTGVETASDRIYSYTWGAFIFTLIFIIVYTQLNNLPPHAMILMLAGMATFISGGIAKFNPFIYGGIALGTGAIMCAFLIDVPYHGLVFAGSILLGYVIPGFILRKQEHGQA